MKQLILSALLLSSVIGFSQSQQSVNQDYKKGLPENVKKDWFNQSLKSAKVYGTGVDEVYQTIIEGQQPKKRIVVAVIDSGVDWEHEDLKDNIWVNADEIPNNGKDDDNNGYVDDVHGWNFLVDDAGNDINGETLEATRVLHTSNTWKESDGPKPAWLTSEIIDESLKVYNQQLEEVKSLENIVKAYNRVDSIMIAEKGENYTFEDAKDLDEKANPKYKAVKRFASLMRLSGASRHDLDDLRNHTKDAMAYHLNMDLVTRKNLTPDQKFYGNNHYEGADAVHGTHVAGIIASNRTNDIGSYGIASTCADIMIVRAVPNGDENDIDVANAIRYAVDNGANIINMSFGKGISPYKNQVISAIEYASAKNVLVVHAAGNDNNNIDEVANFPDVKLAKNSDELSYLTIGALAPAKNKKMLAPFTNFGANSIDIFAPGVDIYSTVPDNKYEYLSGTSMAAPVTSGVAALVWAYHPELSALELKNALIASSNKMPEKKVVKPGTKKEKVTLTQLSKDGSVLNARGAFEQLK